ncbi:MAG: glycoside hydrolase family 95 protein, partial [Muribaculaceae bacterium]|nr:glycoside hydrolase family 95 protein [Muribaculaceae bacterium]
MTLKSVSTIASAAAAIILATAADAFSSEARNTIIFDAPTSSQTPPAWTLPYRDAANSDPEWENGSLPIGNGSFGGNVFGSVGRERVTLNEKSLWMGGPAADTLYWSMNKRVPEDAIPMAREALLRGNNHIADSIVRENFNGTIPYTRDSFGCFTTFGEATVETGIDENKISGYRRTLDVDSSLVKVAFKVGDAAYRREFFASYPDSVMVWRFAAPGTKQRLVFRFATPHETSSSRAVTPGGLLIEGRIANNGMRWALLVEANAGPDGTVNVDPENNTITIEESDDATFLLSADTDYKINLDPDFSDPQTYTGKNPADNVRSIAEAAARRGYASLRRHHIEDYRCLYECVSLSLGGTRERDSVPTGKRLASYRAGEADNALEELLFNFGRYLLISSSRPGNIPANLQGMWHNNIDGPWRVDYHNNIN